MRMGTFSASLKTLGDRRGLPATISLEDDVLSITAGEHEIGSWSLQEITLEPTSAGYRMAAEGEQILIEIPDKDAFAEELSRRSSKGRLRLRRKEKTTAKPAARAKRAPESERPHTPPTYQVPVGPATVEPRPRATAPADPAPRPPRLAEAKARSAEAGTEQVRLKPAEEKPSIMDRVDSILAVAEKRWGALMPPWFFTRMMLYVVVGAFILMLIFPGAVSSFLLAAGLLMVILGAVVYTDDVLASKWLPGRMTPSHVLILGVAVLMFGVLLGVIAR